MASGKSPAQRLPEAVREAVEQAVQVTREQAKDTRGRAQEAVDDLVRGAEASAEAVRDRVRGALEERRPATSDDIRELQTELRAIGRRLDAIEERLPSKRPAAKRSGGSGAKRSSGSRSGGARKGRSSS
jgi:polyhydroxyalkanoate synthesis regulator phasin